MPGMENMPGMAGMESGAVATPNAVTFTAAQVLQGGVAWEAVSASGGMGGATVPGSLVPDEDRTARLGAPVEGRIIAVRVRPGDVVSSGQALVIMHSPGAASAQAELRVAQAELQSRRAQSAYAKSARDRADRLLALKAMPRQEWERAVAEDEFARAAEVQAEAELERALNTAAQLGAAGTSGELVVSAPAAGVVLSRVALPGQVVSAGAPLVTITDPSRLWLVADVPERYASFLKVGATISFHVPAYPGETFPAQIDAVGAGLDPHTRTLPIRATVSSSRGQLKPEMLATVTIAGTVVTAAVSLPADAVQTVGGRPVVFVAVPDGMGGAAFSTRTVEVGARDGARILVTQGLQDGDQVVVRGAFAIKGELEKAAMPDMEMP